MRKAVLVTNIPTPYRVPLFNELSGQLAERGVRLRVLFGGLSYRRRKWEVDLSECRFEYDVLASGVVELSGDAERALFTYRGLLRRVRAFRPDVVVVAGFTPATVKLWLLSWASPTRYVIWTGSTEAQAPVGWRAVLRRLLAKRASGFIAYGTHARAYLIQHLGARPEDVSVGINTVDTTFFSRESDARRASGQGVPRQPPNEMAHLLTIGYLNPRKQVLRLLVAAEALLRTRRDFVIDVVGDGEDRARLERYVEESGLSGHVVFHGYRQRDELPRYFAMSRCFLFPSDYDIWGLVLVEAMAAGLPVIASTEAGATVDLVREGETGFVVDFRDTGRVVERIAWMLDNPKDAEELGRRARAFVEDAVSIPRSARGFADAIVAAMEGAPRATAWPGPGVVPGPVRGA